MSGKWEGEEEEEGVLLKCPRGFEAYADLIDQKYIPFFCLYLSTKFIYLFAKSFNIFTAFHRNSAQIAKIEDKLLLKNVNSLISQIALKNFS